MTLDELRDAVRTRLGVPDTDAIFTDTVLTDLINEGLQYISNEEDWWWLEKTETLSLTDSIQAYDVAADCTRTINVSDPTGIPLSRKGIDELLAMTTAQAAVVRFFAPYAGQLVFFPVPNTSISVNHRYIGGEPALSGDSDTPLIPAQFQPALVDYVVYLCHTRSGNMNEAKGALEVYGRWIETMKARIAKLAESRGGSAA